MILIESGWTVEDFPYVALDAIALNFISNGLSSPTTALL